MSHPRSGPSWYSTTQYQSNYSVKLEILLPDCNGSRFIYQQHPLARLFTDGTHLEAVATCRLLIVDADHYKITGGLSLKKARNVLPGPD